MAANYEYVLGDSPRETRRLEHQARLWDPVAHQLFDRIGVRQGWTVLEIGPGAGSLHSELRRRVHGPVDAVERSPAFATELRARNRADEFGEGHLWQMELGDADLPANTYDLVFARWVFCFLPDPLQDLKKLASALRPGGVLAIQDYAHRESFSLFPRPPHWLDFLEADRRFFATQGGDISIAGRLPALMADAGLTLVEARPTLKTGAPGSSTWEWLFGYFESVQEQLRQIAPLTPAKVLQLRSDWESAATLAQARVFAPTVMDIVGGR